MATSTDPLLRTPLRDAHAALGAKLVPFAGWDMPLDYGSILEESRAVRTGAGIFDVSHMARFLFRGPDVAAELDRALGGCVTDQAVDTARYTMILDENAGILDDLITYRTAEDEYFMVVNASGRARDFEILTSRLGNTEASDLTEDGGGILALQGPDARRILEALSPDRGFCPRFLDLGYLASDFGELFIARTGYTGEHGYEIFVTPEQIEPVWTRLLALGARPVGLGARDVLRLEAALPLYGHEIHEQINPFDANLRFAIKGWKTRAFVGGDALRTLAAAGPPPRELIGLTAEKRVPREGYPVLCAGAVVGQVCSGVWSATLDRPIATAYVRAGTAGPLTVDARGKEIPVERTALPFVPHRSRD
jgi:aminomethyltransferase